MRLKYGSDNHPVPSSPATLAIIAQELTPYRLHFHRRVAREIPEFKLASLLIDDSARSPWQGLDEPEIGVVRFGEGEWASRKRPFVWYPSQIRKARAVAQHLTEINAKALVVIGYHDLTLLSAIFWARRRGIPCFLWGDSNIRGDKATGLRRVIKNIAVPRILRRCTGVLPCGRMGQAFFERYGVSRDRMFFSPCEPDYDQIEHLPTNVISDVQSRLSLDPSRRRVLFCGRLVPAKRPDIALQAFLAVADQRPDWDLVFAGDGPLREQLAAQVPPELHNRVLFTGFIGSQDEVTALYRLCHILLHPAEYEPWALVINEAAAAGLAIITTEVTGAAVELVHDGVNGRLLEPGDTQAFAAALLQVSEPDRLEPMRAASRASLQSWRERADPINGLRAALVSSGALLDPSRLTSDRNSASMAERPLVSDRSIPTPVGGPSAGTS